MKSRRAASSCQSSVNATVARRPSVEKMIEIIRALGAFKMSMLQDVEHGKPVEVDALLTVTHDIGLLVGVPSRIVLEIADASAGGMMLSDQAARSMI